MTLNDAMSDPTGNSLAVYADWLEEHGDDLGAMTCRDQMLTEITVWRIWSVSRSRSRSRSGSWSGSGS